MNILEQRITKSMHLRKSLKKATFITACMIALFVVLTEFQEHGLGRDLYHKAMIASFMLYAMSDLKRLSQKFTSYVKTPEPASKATIALQVMSGVLFLLWVTSD